MNFAYFGIIIVHGGLGLCSWISWVPLNHEFMSPQKFNKVMICLALLCNKPVAHKITSLGTSKIMTIQEHWSSRIRMISQYLSNYKSVNYHQNIYLTWFWFLIRVLIHSIEYLPFCFLIRWRHWEDQLPCACAVVQVPGSPPEWTGLGGAVGETGTSSVCGGEPRGIQPHQTSPELLRGKPLISHQNPSPLKDIDRIEK